MLNEAGLTPNAYLEFKPSAGVGFIVARLVLAAIVLILPVQNQCDSDFFLRLNFTIVCRQPTRNRPPVEREANNSHNLTRRRYSRINRHLLMPKLGGEDAHE